MGHESPTSVVVVGAGVAGLFVARALARRGYAPTVLEASPSLGGRVRTVREGDGRVAYEAGPWRVPSTHARVRALCREFGLALAPAPTPPLHAKHAERDATDDAGLTTWEANALRARDPARADATDLATGYAGQTHSAVGSAPYDAAGADRFDVVLSGLDALVRGLADEGVRRGAVVETDARVVDLNRDDGGDGDDGGGGRGGRYALRVRRRVGSNAFADGVVRADVVFVCVPPHACREWSAFRAHARSTMAAVEPGVLHHVYAHATDERPLRGRHVGTPLLAQTVGSQYHNAWFQASYSGGRVAQLWHRLRMADPVRFVATLREELRRRFGVRVVDDVRSHHWPHAYHAWVAAPHFALARAVRAAVRPNPRALPRVYLAGEAFSSFQAWIEGALETAELALEAYDVDTAAVRTPTNAQAENETTAGPALSLTVEGHALDVTAWRAGHPGGAAPLEAHAGEDVAELMAHIGHSAQAWAAVHALKRG